MTQPAPDRDGLTGALLRTSLHEEIQTRTHEARAKGLPVSVLFMDLDHFKSINDAFGHLRGDQVLAQCVQRIREVAPDPDLIFRYGGDEFVLILPKIGKEQALTLAERLIDRVHTEPFDGDPPIRTTTSVGVATFPHDGETPEALFAIADARHYAAKRSGRNRAVIDAEPSDCPALAEVPRVVERDEELRVVHALLESLPTEGTGLLRVDGKRGSGRTRFLSEVAGAARLRGFAVLALAGSAPLRMRAYGALTQALHVWDAVPSPAEGLSRFRSGLQRLIADKRAAGLVITVDNIQDLDPFSLDLIHDLFTQAPSFPIAMAYTTAPDARSLSGLPPAAIERHVHIHPLSLRGVHVWLRSALRWEPPGAFIQWLHEESQGSPAILERGLQALIAERIITQSPSGWTVAERYAQTPLADYLPQREGCPPVPASTTSFLGREREIADLKELLAKHRLVTIMGPGGTGKTRLAIQVAAELAEQVGGGICYVPLASVASPDLIIPAIATALRLQLSGQEFPLAKLSEHLRHREMLLVLDNMEHLVEGAQILTELLEAAPALRLLTTSRERLQLRGEAVLLLGGLPLPTPEAPWDGQGSLSCMLFVERARLYDRRFALTAENGAHVARICQLVEGSPLGIELAAAWVRMLSCEEIARGMQEHLDFLESRGRDMPERHRSLRTVFAHSWNRLTAREQRAFVALTLFRGGFTVDGAEQVADAHLPLLSALLDKSLLRRTDSGRFEVHELLRQFGVEAIPQVFGPEAADALPRRHATYCLALAESEAKQFSGPRQVRALDRLTQEHDNLRAALTWAINSGEAELALRLSGALWQFWWRRGHLAEGRRWLKAALELDASTPGALTRSQVRAVALAAAAKLALELEGNPLALQQAEASIKLFRENADQAGMVGALLVLGHGLRKRGDYPGAAACFEEAVNLGRKDADPDRVSSGLVGLGLLAISKGEYQSAYDSLSEAAEIQRRLGNREALVRIQSMLATLHMVTGAYQEAEQLLTTALEETAPADSYTRAMNLSLLGELALVQGDLPRAEGFLKQALDLKRTAHLEGQLVDTLLNLGILERRLGRPDQARAYCLEALSLLRTGGDRRNIVNGLVVAAAIAWETGQTERAARLLGAAERGSAAIGYTINLCFRQELLRLRPQLDQSNLVEPHAEGKQLSLDEAVGYAVAQGAQ